MPFDFFQNAMYLAMLEEAESGKAGTQPVKEYSSNRPKKSECFASAFLFSDFFGMFPCLKKSRGSGQSPVFITAINFVIFEKLLSRDFTSLTFVSLIISIYIDSNKEYIPACKENYGASGGMWQDVLMPLYMPSIEPGIYAHLDKSNKWRPRGIFQCPGSLGSDDGRTLWADYGINCTDKAFGSYASSHEETGPVMKMSKIRKPSQRAAVFDLFRSGGAPFAYNKDSMGNNRRHMGSSGFNTMYADGHVVAARAPAIPKEPDDTRPEAYYWGSRGEK